MYPFCGKNQGMLTHNLVERSTHFQWQWDNPNETHNIKKRSQTKHLEMKEPDIKLSAQLEHSIEFDVHQQMQQTVVNYEDFLLPLLQVSL